MKMLRRNNEYEQRTIHDWDVLVSDDRYEMSIWNNFRTEILEQVNENAFSPLYSDNMGRPNTPVNIIVTLLVIKETFDWSFRELKDMISFHSGVLYACGCGAGDIPVTIRTMTNFIQKLRIYKEETGIDLFNEEFNRLVNGQIRRLGLRTKIARTDSTYFNTNVSSYNRLQFLIEIVKRVYRILEEKDKQQFASLFHSYADYDADNYVYNLRGSDIDEEFRKIGHCYYSLQKLFSDKYSNEKSWQLYLRVFKEQFTVTDEEQIELKPSEEMTSSSIRGVDDPEATLRHKSGENYLGYVGNIVETADPDNEINLICDADLCQNNTSDEQMLVDSFDELKEKKLPDLNEIHFDAGYGGKALDEKLDKHEVKGVQTGIRGVKTDCRMDVTRENDTYCAICPAGEKVQLEQTKKGYKAEFTKTKCSSCKYLTKCPVKYMKRSDAYAYYIREEDLPRRLRLTNIKTIPEKRKTLRSGVESTVWQFKCRTKMGKTRLRGHFRHKIWFLLTALAINVRRIYQYTTGTPKNGKSLGSPSLSQTFCHFQRQIASFFNNFLLKIVKNTRIFGPYEFSEVQTLKTLWN